MCMVSVNTALESNGFRPPYDHHICYICTPNRGEKAATATAFIPEAYFCTPELTKIDSVPKRTSSKYIFNVQIPHMPTVLTVNPGRRANAKLKKKNPKMSMKAKLCDVFKCRMSECCETDSVADPGSRRHSTSLKRHIFMK